MLDDRQDYFGQTVNIASRVNELADPAAILATKPIIESAEVARVLREASYRTTPRSSQLRGLSDEFEIFEVRERETAAAAE
jgi:class 3 adenylate cyclase